MPWMLLETRVETMGKCLTTWQLWLLAILSLIVAYLIAIYYMVRYVPLLWVIAIAEGFFVFAYNLEWFEGRFHTDKWFAFSWGFLLFWQVMYANQSNFHRGSCLGPIDGIPQHRRDKSLSSL
jgi:hypothetical protein